MTIVRKVSKMTDYDFTKCVCSLESAWKSVYGLGTQYEGYMTPDMLIALMSARRCAYDYFDWDDEASFSLDNLNRLISDINNDGLLSYTVPLFPDPSNRHYGTAVPKLLKTIKDFDLSPETIPEEEWSQIIAYINSKKK